MKGIKKHIKLINKLTCDYKLFKFKFNGEKTGRITKRGNKLARTTLVQCTLVAIRYSNYLGNFYRKIKQKKSAGKAIITTARKFLKTIYLTIKNNWIFEDFGI